jgi:hypothetical protein
MRRIISKPSLRLAYHAAWLAKGYVDLYISTAIARHRYGVPLPAQNEGRATAFPGNQRTCVLARRAIIDGDEANAKRIPEGAAS